MSGGRNKVIMRSGSTDVTGIGKAVESRPTTNRRIVSGARIRRASARSGPMAAMISAAK